MKKGPTFTQALQEKRAKINPKPAAGISIKELAPKATQTEVMPKAKLCKGKGVELTAKTMNPQDPEYDHMMVVIEDNRKANMPCSIH